ncbi:histidine kinase [Streptomyces sp. NPDC020096]
MDATSRARDLWRRLAEPGQWSRRRVAGECALAAVLGLLTAVREDLSGHGWLRIILVALAGAVVSLLRRALPATMLIAAGALCGGTDCNSLLLIVTGWSAGYRIGGVLRALTAFCTSFALFAAFTHWSGREDMFSFLGFVLLAVVPGFASRYQAQRRALLQALRERNVQLLRERQMIAGQARMRERQRIAQDMHDSLGHQLALVAVHTGALEVDHQLTGQQREVVGVLREASMTAMHELRAVVGILSDGTVEEPKPEAKGVAGIEGLVESAVAAGGRVGLERSGESRPLALAADHAAYRLAQEGLTNAYKHAPGAPIIVSLRYEPDSVLVEVANGPAPQGVGEGHGAVSGGQGLTGLRERARLIGAMVHAGPVEDGGFRLAGMFPYASGQARATVGDEANDFWQQSGTVAPGEGGPVVDRLDPREEIESIMRTKKSNGWLVGCGIGVLILVGLVVAGIFAWNALIHNARRGMIDPSVYASVKVGEAEAQVRAKLPSGESLLTSDLKKQVPAGPAGANCLLLLSSQDSATDPVYRFCFKDGKLAEKREFQKVYRVKS